MEKFVIRGGKKLKGEIKVSGAKNVAMKLILTGILTGKKIFIRNVPLISSVYGTADIVKHLGVQVHIEKNHTATIEATSIKSHCVPLECGGLYRTATMVMGPLLARLGKAIVPNPGGCRLGKRPIDRHIEGLLALGAKITYKDGFFYAEAKKLTGCRFRFRQNTHTGTETLILAAVLADGETVIENAAAEPEIDDLIGLLNRMGAKVKRIKERTIVVCGVKNLTGAEYEIMPDRNEVVTFAIAAAVTGGDIVVDGVQMEYLVEFFKKLKEAGVHWERAGEGRVRFVGRKPLHSTQVVTHSYPGFMTDWQAPWAILMTRAQGKSSIHETVYEDRFGYVAELKKMGGQISFFHPKVDHPQSFYNFNWIDRKKNQYQGIKITGPSRLHNALLEVMDLRAGATLVLAALSASGESIMHGIEHIDRGYERLEDRLTKLGAYIRREK